MTDEEIIAAADACGLMLFGLGMDKAKFEFCILAFAKFVGKIERFKEPVADDFFRMIADKNPKPFPLPQRTWVGLTDDEMEATFMECGGKWNGDFWKIEDADFHPFLRTIEAKLKENT